MTTINPIKPSGGAGMPTLEKINSLSKGEGASQASGSKGASKSGGSENTKGLENLSKDKLVALLKLMMKDESGASGAGQSALPKGIGTASLA